MNIYLLDGLVLGKIQIQRNKQGLEKTYSNTKPGTILFIVNIKGELTPKIKTF